jgi:hypothetical protein
MQQQVKYFGESSYYAATTVFTWENIDIIRYKGNILFLAIGELIMVLPIIVMWFMRKIPTMPFTILAYGAVYYIIFLVVWLMNLGMAFARSKELFWYTMIINVVLFGWTSFLLFVIWYQLYLCWMSQSSNPTCSTYQTTDIITGGFTGILWFITLFIMLSFIGICARVANSTTVKNIVQVVRNNGNKK